MPSSSKTDDRTSCSTASSGSASSTENHELAYRRARVEALLDPLDQEDRRALHDARHRLEALVGPVVEGAGAEVHIPPTIPDHELVNALAQYLPLDAVEKQALLERDGVARPL